MQRKLTVLAVLLLMLSFVLPAAVSAQDINTGAETTTVNYSHRLIVELASPPLSAWYAAASAPTRAAAGAGGRLEVNSPAAQNYVQQLQAEQQTFVARMQQAIPGARVGAYRDESGALRPATYQLAFNGVSVDAGQKVDLPALERRLSRMAGVKHVYRDYAHQPDLYASLPLINAAAAWNNTAIGGVGQAGAGVKFATVDGGAHHLAAMFDGTGYSYPPGFPKGDTRNTNGKIIASRAYFRTWDPPSPGDEYAWPGPLGTPHGTHTTSTAVGEQVTASFLGITQPISGVAPKAYIMSYRVFYNSITNNGNFYTVEGLKALEDMVADGADVVNNSWGGGPTSLGGVADPIDAALINAVKAGVFVSLSNGNAGPGLGTGDHSAADYISVAASTTTGTFAAGRFQVTAPVPVPANLTAMPYGSASFGPALPLGQVVGPYSYKYSADVDPTNLTGCVAWTGTPFQGVAALIERGACDFSSKVYNAQQAGATFVIIYNQPSNGDTIINMGPGANAALVTISSILIGNTNGLAVASWLDANPTTARVALNTQAFQVGATPDLIAVFSSRGPGVGNVLKPDIAAPGVNILAQGYGEQPGEAGALGWGQVSGTSMASPHVAGSAVLLKQIHPDWSPAWIKSALMSTSKYIGIYLQQAPTTPAQPLDMGAGRLDLTNAANPGVILDPPSLSFGQVISGTTGSLTVTLTSVAGAPETYDLSTLYTGGGYTNPPAVDGMTITPSSITLAPGESKTINVQWDPALAGGYGDHQGFVTLSGSTHQAHLPAWMRTLHEVAGNDVLLIVNDGNFTLGLPSYVGYYTRTLTALGLGYDVWDADSWYGNAATLPDATELARYGTIIYETGDNYFPNGSFTVTTPPTTLDSDRLTEYFNAGGHVLAFGQDLGLVFAADTTSPLGFYPNVLGGAWVQDSVNSDTVFTTTSQLLAGTPGSPFSNMSFDVSARGDGAGNQTYIDEVKVGCSDPDFPAICRMFGSTMKYAPGGANVADGLVGLTNRDQPTLENPGVTSVGRAMYFSFGLEGVANDTGANTREQLLAKALDWTQDAAGVSITPVVAPIGDVSQFTASMTSSQGGPGVSYRWDFGDGSAFSLPSASATAGHTYSAAGEYNVRVEATNGLGTRAIGQVTVNVTNGLDVTPAPASRLTRAGSSAGYVLHVTNNGKLPDTFGFKVDGALWTTDLPADLPLAVGASADVPVTVHVPAAALAGAQDTAHVTVFSRTNANATTSVDLVTTALVYGVALAPHEDAKAGFPGEMLQYVVMATNTGNYTDTFTLTLTNSFPGLPVVPPVVFSLPGGASAPLPISAQIPAAIAGFGVLPGDHVANLTTLTITSGSDPTKHDTALLTTTVKWHEVLLVFVQNVVPPAP